MKLLLFSDLRTDTAAALRLVDLARDVDVVIGAGDFASVRRGLSSCINVLRDIKAPSLLVPGNNESYDELCAACASWASAKVLHGTGVEIGGQFFFGLGGGVPLTPFGSWSFDLSEADATSLLARCPADAVLISHSPPKGAVDISSSGQSLGSTAVRDAVLQLEPRLVVCGHIHACAGQQARIAKTLVINAGPSGVIHELK